MNAHHVDFNPRKLRTFRRALADAQKQQRQVFRFEDNEYLVSYAKYLVEYLVPRLGG